MFNALIIYDDGQILCNMRTRKASMHCVAESVVKHDDASISREDLRMITLMNGQKNVVQREPP